MADSSHVDSNVITSATDSSGSTVVAVVQTNVTESTQVTSNIVTGGKGDTGAAGADGLTRLISVVSTPTTAGSTLKTDYVYLVSGTTTLTLPSAVSNTNRYTVSNVGSNTITVATTSAQTINGSSTATLPKANMSLDFISNNSNWIVE